MWFRLEEETELTKKPFVVALDNYNCHTDTSIYAYKAMTYNTLVSHPLKYHLTMWARGYYLSLSTERVFFQETPLITHTERNMIMEDGLA